MTLSRSTGFEMNIKKKKKRQKKKITGDQHFLLLPERFLPMEYSFNVLSYISLSFAYAFNLNKTIFFVW